MASLYETVLNYCWAPAASASTRYSGHLAAVLRQFDTVAHERQLLDRAETPHFDIAVHKERVLTLVKWCMEVEKKQASYDVDNAALLKAQKLRLCKRIFEICEQERDWLLEFDPVVRACVFDLLYNCAAEYENDSGILYYRNALLPANYQPGQVVEK